MPKPCPPVLPSRLGAALLAMAGLAACSVDGYGLSATRVSQGDGALVVEVYSLGANLRLQSGDQGFGLGASRRSYVFPAAQAAKLAPGWHYFLIDLPALPPVAMRGTSYGLDLQAGPAQTGLSLGFSETILASQPPAEASLLMQLSFHPDLPAQTRLSYCRKDTMPC